MRLFTARPLPEHGTIILQTPFVNKKATDLVVAVECVWMRDLISGDVRVRNLAIGIRSDDGDHLTCRRRLKYLVIGVIGCKDVNVVRSSLSYTDDASGGLLRRLSIGSHGSGIDRGGAKFHNSPAGSNISRWCL